MQKMPPAPKYIVHSISLAIISYEKGSDRKFQGGGAKVWTDPYSRNKDLTEVVLGVGAPSFKDGCHESYDVSFSHILAFEKCRPVERNASKAEQ